MTRDEVQAAIRQWRQEGGGTSRLFALCLNGACPVDEVDLTIRESARTKPLQVPLRCVRCGQELSVEELR